MDQAAFHFINTQLTNPVLDIPMAALSSWAVWWPLAILAGVAIFLLGAFHARAMLLAAVVLPRSPPDEEGWRDGGPPASSPPALWRLRPLSLSLMLRCPKLLRRWMEPLWLSFRLREPTLMRMLGG